MLFAIAIILILFYTVKHVARLQVACNPQRLCVICSDLLEQLELMLMLDTLRGSGGRNALVILEGKIKGKKAQGRPKRMWFDGIRQWTMLNDYGES